MSWPFFNEKPCKDSINYPSGQLDQAATWLLENAENMVGQPKAKADSGTSSHSAPLSGVEVKAESVCICFIDDCLDCDIPLAELTFSSKPHLFFLLYYSLLFIVAYCLSRIHKK